MARVPPVYKSLLLALSRKANAAVTPVKPKSQVLQVAEVRVCADCKCSGDGRIEVGGRLSFYLPLAWRLKEGLWSWQLGSEVQGSKVMYGNRCYAPVEMHSKTRDMM